jgi:hypothetical protein
MPHFLGNCLIHLHSYFNEQSSSSPDITLRILDMLWMNLSYFLCFCLSY